MDTNCEASYFIISYICRSFLILVCERLVECHWNLAKICRWICKGVSCQFAASDTTINAAVIFLSSDHPSLLELFQVCNDNFLVATDTSVNAYIFIATTDSLACSLTHWLMNSIQQDLLWEVDSYSFAFVMFRYWTWCVFFHFHFITPTFK